MHTPPPPHTHTISLPLPSTQKFSIKKYSSTQSASQHRIENAVTSLTLPDCPSQNSGMSHSDWRPRHMWLESNTCHGAQFHVRHRLLCTTRAIPDYSTIIARLHYGLGWAHARLDLGWAHSQLNLSWVWTGAFTSAIWCRIVYQWCFLCNILIFCVKMFSCVFFYKPLLQAVKRQISLFTLFYPWQIKFDIINTPNASPVCNTSRPQVCVNVQWKTSCTLALLQSPADHGMHLSQDDGGGGGGGSGFFLACQDVWRIFDN